MRTRAQRLLESPLVVADARGQLVLLPTEPLSYFTCVNLEVLGPLPPDGAHIYGTGRADDQLHYHLKGNLENSRAALNEYLLTHLAKVAKLPTVQFKPVRHNGRHLFGSETLTGLLPPTEIVSLLRGSPFVPGLPSAITRVLSFDLLMGNPDRHYKNFLIQDIGNGGRIVRVIDFSTAGLMSRYWQTCAPVPETSETVKQLEKLKRSLGTNKDAGREVLTIVGALPSNYWHRIVDQIPPSWSSSEYFRMFVEWWGDGRIQSLELANKELDRYA